MTQKPRKGDFGELKCKKFPAGACPQTSLEIGNRSVLFYSRSVPASQLSWLGHIDIGTRIGSIK